MEKRLEEAMYKRYHIETSPAPDIVPWPNRFLVNVNRIELAKLLVKEIIAQRGDWKAISSRPCMYGTFSGPIGGFAPRPVHCVGCLRCTTQHPKVVEILHNPERLAFGDAYFNSKYVNAIAYEASTGSIPVKGAGYRGEFGGSGWDSMWTDMSEIVRPTRDGIHGREFISTVVDIGKTPDFLTFDTEGNLVSEIPSIVSIPIPFIFDSPPPNNQPVSIYQVLTSTAEQIDTYSIVPVEEILEYKLGTEKIIPLVSAGNFEYLYDINQEFDLIEMKNWNENLYTIIQDIQPQAMIILRLTASSTGELVDHAKKGISIFHLAADYHGNGQENKFMLDMIWDAHTTLVETNIRDQITLIGSGGIVAAEHLPKAIIAGLDLVALDTPPLVALQAEFNDTCENPQGCSFTLPDPLPLDWGIQRLMNMTGAWRDQLLEILGAMGLREVRRLRGEIGRAMFQVDLEREAFAGIEGYDNGQ